MEQFEDNLGKFINDENIANEKILLLPQVALQRVDKHKPYHVRLVNLNIIIKRKHLKILEQQHIQRRKIQYYPMFCQFLETYSHTHIVIKVKDTLYISGKVKVNTFMVIIKKIKLKFKGNVIIYLI